MKSLGQFVHPLLPPWLTMNACFCGAPISLHPVSAPLLTETWERLGAEPRKFPARSARGCAACALCAPVTLAARAPRAGDSVPLISRCAHRNLPQLGEDRVRSPSEETSPPRKFHLVLGGRKRDPRGARRGARAAGRAGAVFPLWVVPVRTSAVPDRPTWRTDSTPDRRTRAGVGRRAPRSGLLPPGCARAAAGRARRCPGESRAG